MKKIKNFNFKSKPIIIALFISLAVFSLGFSSMSSSSSINSGFLIYQSLADNDSCLVFDKEELNRTMEKLNKELIMLNGIKVQVKVDKDQIRKELKRLKENSIFESEKINKIMENLEREFEEHPFDINVNFDFDELNESMKELMLKMKDMKIDMSNLKAEMKKLKSFLKEMKTELIKDGYIDNEDEDFDLEFSNDKLIVNGEELPEYLLEKYKELYEKHFGREIDSKFRMKN